MIPGAVRQRVQVDVIHMSREELERAVLHLQGLNRSLVETVRENTKPDWKVHREVEAVLDRYAVKATYVRNALIEGARIREAQQRNDGVWARVGEGLTPN